MNRTTSKIFLCFMHVCACTHGVAQHTRLSEQPVTSWAHFAPSSLGRCKVQALLEGQALPLELPLPSGVQPVTYQVPGKFPTAISSPGQASPEKSFPCLGFLPRGRTSTFQVFAAVLKCLAKIQVDSLKPNHWYRPVPASSVQLVPY